MKKKISAIPSAGNDAYHFHLLFTCDVFHRRSGTRSNRSIRAFLFEQIGEKVDNALEKIAEETA